MFPYLIYFLRQKLIIIRKIHTIYFNIFYLQNQMEEWPSGLRQQLAKLSYIFLYHGFESLFFRLVSLKLKFNKQQFFYIWFTNNLLFSNELYYNPLFTNLPTVFVFCCVAFPCCFVFCFVALLIFKLCLNISKKPTKFKYK